MAQQTFIVNGQEIPGPEDATPEQVAAAMGVPVSAVSVKGGAPAAAPTRTPTAARGTGATNLSTPQQGHTLLRLLPAASGALAAPLTGGMSLIPAALTIGGATAGGSLVRSALDDTPETIPQALRTAAGEGLVGALSEGVMRPAIRLMQAPFARAGNAVARRLLGAPATAEGRAMAETALTEGALPGIHSGAVNASRRMAELGDEAMSTIATHTPRPAPTLDVRRIVANGRSMRQASDAALMRPDNAPDLAMDRGVRESIINNPKLTTPTPQRVLESARAGQRAFAGTDTLRGELNRGFAQDAFGEVGRAVPQAAPTLERMQKLTPIEFALSHGQPMIEPQGLPTIAARIAAATVNRGAGGVSRALSSVGRMNPGALSGGMRAMDAMTDQTLSDPVREWLIQHMMQPIAAHDVRR